MSALRLSVQDYMYMSAQHANQIQYLDIWRRPHLDIYSSIQLYIWTSGYEIFCKSLNMQDNAILDIQKTA